MVRPEAQCPQPNSPQVQGTAASTGESSAADGTYHFRSGPATLAGMIGLGLIVVVGVVVLGMAVVIAVIVVVSASGGRRDERER